METNADCNISWNIFLSDGTTKADTDYPNVVHADNTQDGGVKIRINYSTYTFRSTHEQTDPTFKLQAVGKENLPADNNPPPQTASVSYMVPIQVKFLFCQMAAPASA